MPPRGGLSPPLTTGAPHPVDLFNHDRLTTALRALDIDTADAVHLGLQQLTFCDSGGSSALSWFERESRLSGHPTHIRGATRTVQLVLTVLAHGDVPTFV